MLGYFFALPFVSFADYAAFAQCVRNETINLGGQTAANVERARAKCCGLYLADCPSLEWTKLACPDAFSANATEYAGATTLIEVCTIFCTALDDPLGQFPWCSLFVEEPTLPFLTTEVPRSPPSISPGPSPSMIETTLTGCSSALSSESAAAKVGSLTNSRIDAGSIVGAVIGGLCAAALIGFLVFCFVRRQNPQQEQEGEAPQQSLPEPLLDEI
jgi:hypothetical protein